MKSVRFILLVVALLLSNISIVANAQDLSKCRIGVNNDSIVSLGFPVRKERLANISEPKILVLPYQLKNEPKYVLSVEDKEVFKQTEINISKLSNNKSNVKFIYNSTISLTMTASELDDVVRNRLLNWRRDFASSTYGFVEQAIIQADREVDYTGIDAVILFGSSANRNQFLGEAMMLTNDPKLQINEKNNSGGKWFDPIRTLEGKISNIVLVYNMFSSYVFTHEIMHLYGLVDLYGSKSSPPMSLMNDDSKISLLAYEKWILGWLPDSNVICVNSKNDLSLNPINNRYIFNLSKGDQTLVIPVGSMSALIVDIITLGASSYLIFYALDNMANPPITNFRQANGTTNRLSVSQYGGVSTIVDSPDYKVLISENDGSNVVINLIPSPEVDSEYSQFLIKQAQTRKLENDGRRRTNSEMEVEVISERQVEITTAAPNNSKKKTTITCVKGKLTKKVTGVKPKCPTGYKVKK